AGRPEPEPVSADLGAGPPIFESVRSGYHYAFGRAPLRSSEQQAGQSPGQPARPPASWGNGSGGAVAGIPTAGPASPGLPQRIPQPGQVRRPAADPGAPQAPAAGLAEASAAELAEITRSKVASFQRGSRRARAVAQMNRSAKQPGQDG